MISWYLEQISHTIDTEEELIDKKILIEKVLDRLIVNVCIYFAPNYYVANLKKGVGCGMDSLEQVYV